jgi:hypothetical protein
VDGTVNFNDVSRGIVIGFCLGLLWAAEEVLVGSDVISSTLRQASTIGLLCGHLVLASCADRAAGERMLADVRSGLERLRAVDGPQGFLLRTTPENIRPGRREAG